MLREQQPGYAVKRLQLLVRSATDEAVEPLGLTMAQFAVLRILADAGPMYASALAERCFTTRQSMQDVLKWLLARRLIEKSPFPTHGRALDVSLTDQGRALIDDATERVKAVDEAMLGGLTTRQREQFLTWLNRCADNLTHGAAGGPVRQPAEAGSRRARPPRPASPRARRA
jgi:DNA-binding MarR family transcriptional regulator